MLVGIQMNSMMDEVLEDVPARRGPAIQVPSCPDVLGTEGTTNPMHFEGRLGRHSWPGILEFSERVHWGLRPIATQAAPCLDLPVLWGAG